MPEEAELAMQLDGKMLLGRYYSYYLDSFNRILFVTYFSLFSIDLFI